MKILLINPEIRENSPPQVLPVGLAIIAAVMVQEGHEIHVYDKNALRVSINQMLRELRKIKDVSVIGLGGLITVYNNIKKIVPALREQFPHAKIVLGGGVTIEPDVIFKNMQVDYCVHAEGEITFLELCKAIEARQADFSQILGISYVENEKLVRTKPRPIERDIDQFPMPAYDLFPTEIYMHNYGAMFRNMGLDAKRRAPLITSRGCPNQCTFCWRMAGRTIRYRSLDLVLEEIAFLRSNYGVDSYGFMDECFNANRKRSIEFATKLIERGFDAPWGASSRVDNFDEEFARILRQSGCVFANFGIESGSPKILKEMKKNASPQQASIAVSNAGKAGISAGLNFVIGMPGETKDTIKETIRWIRKNRKWKSACGFHFATPYPGCELYYQPEVQKRIEEKYGSKDSFFSSLGNASEFRLNMTRLTDTQLIELREKAKREAWAPKWFPSWSPDFLLPSYLFVERLVRLIFQPSRWAEVVKRRLKILTTQMHI
ncbi:MAG TPA: radical SAM protein [archaeon]|nr:radical SAM protein [archaeon]